jgi:hypothetical protein
MSIPPFFVLRGMPYPSNLQFVLSAMSYALLYVRCLRSVCLQYVLALHLFCPSICPLPITCYAIRYFHRLSLLFSSLYPSATFHIPQYVRSLTASLQYCPSPLEYKQYVRFLRLVYGSYVHFLHLVLYIMPSSAFCSTLCPFPSHFFSMSFHAVDV